MSASGQVQMSAWHVLTAGFSDGFSSPEACHEAYSQGDDDDAGAGSSEVH